MVLFILGTVTIPILIALEAILVAALFGYLFPEVQLGSLVDWYTFPSFMIGWVLIVVYFGFRYFSANVVIRIAVGHSEAHLEVETKHMEEAEHDFHSLVATIEDKTTAD
ncbi:hypothetical protein EU538_06760 [Candidatus Thorarchaeota archaeon]|nr:MAG: hypothetical protein EU538_06760 [Candidatus Thorarchaeota archaeon]